MDQEWRLCERRVTLWILHLSTSLVIQFTCPFVKMWMVKTEQEPSWRFPLGLSLNSPLGREGLVGQEGIHGTFEGTN